MNQIVLTEEQMTIVRLATDPVKVCDPQGIVLGHVDPDITPEFIAELKRRAASPGPWYTGEQVQNHLKGLEEAWQREGPFDSARAKEILKELRAADKP